MAFISGASISGESLFFLNYLWYFLGRFSLLLQQSGDVDVPADGLSVEAAREQVTGLGLLVPRRAANHPPVTHPVAARQSSQSHSAHVEQSNLTIVVRQSDDPVIGRNTDPVHSGVRAYGSDGRPHVLQIPHFNGSVVAPRDHIVPRGEHG